MEAQRIRMFSVVIPVFNNKETLYEAVSSVISQTRYDLIDDIIIVNDGSKDETATVVYELKNKTKKIKYIFQKNQGASAARNRGIRESKSDWIALLDGDDKWLPNKIERQYQEIERNPGIVFLGTQYPLKMFIKKKYGLVKLNARQLCFRSMPCTPSVVFKREVGMELGLFDVNQKYNEDAFFFQKFLLMDSYYILAEKLIEIDIGKRYFGESGLSSNYVEMYKGKKRNIRELNSLGLISSTYMYVMILLCDLKCLRMFILRLIRGKMWK